MSRGIQPDEAEMIKNMIYRGVTLQNIHERTGRTIKFLQKNFGNFIKHKPKREILGHKDEPYYSEKELLNLDHHYDYDSLSDDEKKIFHGE